MCAFSLRHILENNLEDVCLLIRNSDTEYHMQPALVNDVAITITASLSNDVSEIRDNEFIYNKIIRIIIIIYFVE